MADNMKVESFFSDGFGLLVRKNNGTHLLVSLATNQSMHLWNVRPGITVRFDLRPGGAEAFYVMRNTTGRHIIRRMPGEFMEPLNFDLTLSDCWHQLKKEKSK